MANQPCCHGLSPLPLKAVEELGDVAPSFWKARRAKWCLQVIKECIDTFGMAKPTWRHRMGSNSCWSFECWNQSRGCCVPFAPFNSFYIKNGFPTVSFKKFSSAIEDWHPVTESDFLCHLAWRWSLCPGSSNSLHNSRARMEFPGTSSATMQITNTRMNQELSFLSLPKVSAEAADDHATLQVGHEWKSVRFCTAKLPFQSFTFRKYTFIVPLLKETLEQHLGKLGHLHRSKIIDSALPSFRFECV